MKMGTRLEEVKKVFEQVLELVKTKLGEIVLFGI